MIGQENVVRGAQSSILNTRTRKEMSGKTKRSKRRSKRPSRGRILQRKNGSVHPPAQPDSAPTGLPFHGSLYSALLICAPGLYVMLLLTPRCHQGMFRDFGRGMAQYMFHLEDEAASMELLREWRDQRWRPLFGSLKIDPALPTNDLVCAPWPKSDEWAKKLSPLMEWVADWHHAEHRDVR